jgi:hypothetical protein
MTDEQHRARMFELALEECSQYTGSTTDWPETAPHMAADHMNGECACPKVPVYFSFVGEEGFLGANVVLSGGYFAGLRLTHKLKINPGGEVLGGPWPEEIPEEFLNRLLTNEDIDRMSEMFGRQISAEAEIAQALKESEDA